MPTDSLGAIYLFWTFKLHLTQLIETLQITINSRTRIRTYEYEQPTYILHVYYKYVYYEYFITVRGNKYGMSP